MADPMGVRRSGGPRRRPADQEVKSQARTRLPGQRNGSVGKNASEISAVIFGF